MGSTHLYLLHCSREWYLDLINA
ncbi:unnamed protein product [Spirodela intermedia]|uniref:Uncharacterized protein n=1 Tax=Spirodela intermedia TaxID=51605 RepID=A0A7I8LBX5_SPIIN|nr:unnamed protein product [Spirodela intermedia]